MQRPIVNYSGLDILATTIGVSAVYDSCRNKVDSVLIDAAKNTDGIITDNNLIPFVLLVNLELR